MIRTAPRKGIATAVCLALLSAQLNAATITVTSTADSGPGTLRAAVASAVANDVIVFDPAIDGMMIGLTSGEIAIGFPLTITGNDTTNTIISGTGTSRIFNITSAGNVAIASLKLTMGSAVDGGALYASASSVTLTACAVTNSTAAIRGGGIYAMGGTLDLVNSRVRANSAAGNLATDGGGGIYNNGTSVLTIGTGSEVLGNAATGTAGSGGGIFNNTGSMLMASGAIISGNTSVRAGGGIEQNGAGASIMLTNVTLDDNSTGPAPGNGGGLHITGPGSATITGGTVNGNTATTEGGGLWNGTGAMTVNGTVIDGNTANGALADQGGGGLFNLKGTLTVQNGTIISDNMATGAAGSGGGIMNDSTATLIVLNSTLSGNSATRAGGGIEFFAKAGQIATASLTNVTITGNSTGTAPGNGGGVHITGPGVMSVTSCTVTGNTAAAEGGGLWNGSGTMTIDDCDITGNTAHGSVNPATPNSALDLQGGGGIFNNLGTVNIVNTIGATTITGNLADGSTFGSGGGILSVGGSFTITGATISGNETVRAGGGIENGASNMSISNSVLNDNDISAAGAVAAATPGNGGAIHVTGAGTMNVMMCTADGNVVANEGGGLWGSGTGTMTVTRSTISDNSALDGGGLFLQAGGGTLTVNYSTVSGNTATNGGGVQPEGGTLTLTGVTIANNTATTGGGVNVVATTVNANSSLIADNTATTGPDFNGAFASAAFTLLESGADATGIANGSGGNSVGTDPALQPLANNGGPTFTHALGCTSIAINAGDPGDASNDQRGQAVSGSARDQGAFESQGTFNALSLTFTLDAFGSEVTWEVRRASDNGLAASGGPYADTPVGAVVMNGFCVASDSYNLIVMDAGGNGIPGGGYVMRDASDRRIIDANGMFTSSSSVNLPFDVPLSNMTMQGNSCDRTNVMANTNLYALTQPGSQNYQFWFFDPHGSYGRRITVTPNRVRPNQIVSVPLPLDMDLNVRVRVRVAGVWSPFGAACRVRLPEGGMQQRDASADPVFTVYPNPVRDGRVTVRMDNLMGTEQHVNVEVFGTLGERVYQDAFANSGEVLNTVLDIGESHAPGMYTIRLLVNDVPHVQRLIIE